jgi:hypothetical protein
LTLIVLVLAGPKRRPDIMNRVDWETSDFPKEMLEFVQSRTTDRKMRLFACACCRRFWDSLPDPRSRHFVETVERFADGLETDASLDESHFAAQEVVKETSDTVAYGVCATCEYQHAMRGVTAERAATLMAHRSSEGVDSEWNEQARILRDILGPLPFQPISLNPLWLTATVTGLAATIYDERAFENLPLLADALEDAAAIMPKCCPTAEAWIPMFEDVG